MLSYVSISKWGSVGLVYVDGRCDWIEYTLRAFAPLSVTTLGKAAYYSRSLSESISRAEDILINILIEGINNSICNNINMEIKADSLKSIRSRLILKTPSSKSRILRY